jgi:hypothetical protein
MFDVGADNFVAPPPVSLDYPYYITPLYGIDSLLNGIRFKIDFTETFQKTLLIHNELYRDTVFITEFNKTVYVGDSMYTHDVYANYAVGLHSLKIYFGGVPIGAALFIVVSSDNRLCVIPLSD